MSFWAFWGAMLLIFVVGIVISFLIPDFIDVMAP